MPHKILLVEDEENLLKTIKLNLELEGYLVSTAETGTKAIQEFGKAKHDLIILDVMLPGISGFDVCEYIRKENKDVPVLFLTAKGTSMDRVQGLKLGADDYLTKPFELEEFLLRVRNLLKRAGGKTNGLENYTLGNYEINFSNYEVKNKNGEKRTLTNKEIQLLKLLIENKNKVVSRDVILENIWGADVYPTARTIDNYILAFRKYFENNPKEPQHFHSIRGVGYKFTD